MTEKIPVLFIAGRGMNDVVVKNIVNDGSKALVKRLEESGEPNISPRTTLGAAPMSRVDQGKRLYPFCKFY